MNELKGILSSLTVLAVSALLVAPLAAGHHEDSKDVVDTAVAAGSFNTLVAAVQAAELVDALKADGPITVFAPNDAAFAKLPEGTLDDLLKPENRDQLTAILTFHVVPGKLMASDVLALQGSKTLQGGELSYESRDGKVYVDGSEVIQADIETSNGVIHVIDTVMLPRQEG